jgi:phenylalanyl-tRNA synthetase beta subunit
MNSQEEMTTIDDYFRTQQVPLQWSPVLHSLAQELAENADTQALHQLFFNVGSRFANNMQHQFEGIQTLSALTAALNDLWNRTNWGFVNLNEAKGAIEIVHRYAPLAEAFGDEMLVWSIGILEGFYQTVFRSFGASEKMLARFVPEQSDALNIHLRLAP